MANQKIRESLGHNVSFQIYPSPIITDDFSNVKAVGIVTHEGAAMYISPMRMHAQVFATLPAGTPNDYRLYDYLIVQPPNGKPTAIGLPWINESTFRVGGSTEIMVTIFDKNNDDVANLRRILMENNFTNFEINVVLK